jgi:hypothetical protein
MPDVSPKLVNRHWLARATAARPTHRESELGRDAARRLVLTLTDVGRDAVGVGPPPEVADGDAHRLCRDPLVPPLLSHPPARLDLVRVDPLDAIPGKAQLGAAEETFAAEIPNRPGAEAMLSPLHLTGSGVPQRVSGAPRGACMLSFVEPGKRSQDQPCRSENDPAADIPVWLGPSFVHAASMNPRGTGVVGDRLMLRLGQEAAQTALKQPHVSPMDFTRQTYECGRALDPHIFK